MKLFLLAVLLAVAASPTSADELSQPPGSQTLIVDRGKIVFEKNTGVLDLHSRRRVDAHTRFEIGSVTKQFTAAAILQLKERGKLSLSDPLGKYVTQYALGKDITLQQLLWQVSGIPDYMQNPDYWKRIKRHGYRAVFSKPLDLAAVLSLIKNRPLHFTPGAKWQYSNTNYVLLGAVVAAASGIPWERYIRENIYLPARMTDSAFASDEASIANMATGYGEARDTHKPIPTGPDVSTGDGGIVSTARDLAKWDAALFGGEIVSKRDLALMTARGPKPAGPDQGYGFGWAIDRFDDTVRYEHNGRSIGTVASNQVYPGLSQFVIVLANANYAVSDELANAAFDRRNPVLAAKQAVAAKGEVQIVTARAKSLWNGIMKGPLDRNLFDRQMSAFMTGERVSETRRDYEHLGAATSWTYKGKTRLEDLALYKYRLAFKNGTVLYMLLGINAAGKVSSLLFTS